MLKDCIDFSPIAQDYLWVAEYTNGDGVSEVDFETLKENNFYEIDKNRLQRFGLIGRRKKMFFECSGGTFNLLGKRLNISYKVGDKIYRLTDNGLENNDLITYKRAAAILDVAKQGEAKSEIISYSFGYKNELIIDNIKFNIKFIIETPHGKDEDCLLHIHIVTDKDLDGILEISDSIDVIDRYEAPLVANNGGQLTWKVKV